MELDSREMTYIILDIIYLFRIWVELNYLMKEIINNYERNYNNPNSKRIVLVVDEAHNFIDSNSPVALDMMKNMAKRIRKYSGSLWVATQNIAGFVGFDINIRTKATAVINNCQYTFLFGLKPDDIDQVKTMYSKSTVGALTEEEIDFLSMAGQGDALLMVDVTTRISFHASLKDIEKEESLILHKDA
ncbi:MAG: type IV secretory system conjugative DNA transfer family protein [Bacilli bacterium]|nr:type IV secretory system conjugative DNA transfer family protein [Bacilli bacterium]